jgi:hypothetical protein
MHTRIRGYEDTRVEDAEVYTWVPNSTWHVVRPRPSLSLNNKPSQQ